MAGTCGIGLRKPGKPKEDPETDDAGDLVSRGSEAGGPDRAWSVGITCAKARQGRLRVAAVVGIWSRMVVGRAVGPRMAIERRRPSSGPIHHSDHGSQHRSPLLGKTVREHMSTTEGAGRPAGSTPTAS